MRQILRKARYWGRHAREKYVDDFVFIHINKTAGSSIEQALHLRFEHKTALEKRTELGEAAWANRFSFAFVRNPWDRLVSLYHYRVKTNTTGLGDNAIDFKTWVRLTFHHQDPAYFNSPKMLMPQWHWLIDEEGQMMVDFVGRFENLDADFQALCTKINKKATLPHLKQTRREPYPSYYDEASIDIVRAWFKDDIEQFGYEF